MKIKAFIWSDKSVNGFSGKREEIDPFLEWKKGRGLELIEEKEMTVAEYDLLDR